MALTSGKGRMMDEQLYLMAVGLSLDEKVHKAIENLREYEREALKRDPVNGYYLCDSYGKDSCVILHLAQRAGVKFAAHHNLTTLDPPELMAFGKTNHPDTIIHKRDMSLLQTLVEKKGNGPPTRISRWCCQIFKESTGGDSILVFGIRAQESKRRAALWKTWTPWKTKNKERKDTWVLNPILYWTDEDVWRYIRDNNIPYCSLYDEGWNRLGCIGCPMHNQNRAVDFARWPKYERGWKRAFEKFWAKWHGVPLQRERWVSTQGKHRFTPLPTERLERRYVKERKRDEDGFWTLRRWYDLRGWTQWEQLWQWWMEELPEPENDDCQMGLF